MIYLVKTNLKKKKWLLFKLKMKKEKKKRGETREERKAPSGFTSTQHTPNGFSNVTTRVLLREARGNKWFQW